MKDYEEEEYALLARKTGIPVAEIPNALKAYDWLFPIKGDWLKEKNLPYHNLKLMTMFSVPFQGIGVNYRRNRYSTDGKLRSLKVAGDHTIDELEKWGRLAYSVLSSAQEVD